MSGDNEPKTKEAKQPAELSLDEDLCRLLDGAYLVESEEKEFYALPARFKCLGIDEGYTDSTTSTNLRDLKTENAQLKLRIEELQAELDFTRKQTKATIIVGQQRTRETINRMLSSEIIAAQELLSEPLGEEEKRKLRITDMQRVIQDREKELEELQKILRKTWISHKRELETLRQTESQPFWCRFNSEFYNLESAVKRMEGIFRDVNEDQSSLEIRLSAAIKRCETKITGESFAAGLIDEQTQLLLREYGRILASPPKRLDAGGNQEDTEDSTNTEVQVLETTYSEGQEYEVGGEKEKPKAEEEATGEKLDEEEPKAGHGREA